MTARKTRKMKTRRVKRKKNEQMNSSSIRTHIEVHSDSVVQNIDLLCIDRNVMLYKSENH